MRLSHGMTFSLWNFCLGSREYVLCLIKFWFLKLTSSLKASINFLKERKEKKILQEKILLLSGGQNSQNISNGEKNNLSDENEILLQKANEKIFELQQKINSYEDLVVKQN